MSLTTEQRKAIYAALAAPFPEDAIERTSKAETRRSFDTTGIRYQYVVNRLNEVLGVGGWRAAAVFTVRETRTAKDRAMFEALCELTLELGAYEGGAWLPFAQAFAIGGHTSLVEVDARKGAHTNAFKKAAAFFGAGRQAYEGTLDDDAQPQPQQQSQQRPAAPSAQELAHWRGRIAGCEDKEAIDALWAELLKAHPRQENPLGLIPDFRKRVEQLRQQAAQRSSR